MTINHLHREYRPRQRGWTSSQLIRVLVIIAGIYIGWMIFVLQNLGQFDSGSDEIDLETKSELTVRLRDFINVQKARRIFGKGKSTLKKFRFGANTHGGKDEPEPEDWSTIREPVRAQLSDYKFDKFDVKRAMHGFPNGIKPLTAYVEQTNFNNEIPDTRSRGKKGDDKDHGEPPKYKHPLPVRKTKPNDLLAFQYSKLDSCDQLQAKLPTDAGLTFVNGTLVVTNTNNHRFTFDYVEEAKHCPVDADPFLPWLHDVIPSTDGKTIHFVAQNRRRCNTGWNFGEQLQRLEPQVSLMQPVGVKKVADDDESIKEIVDGLWSPEADETDYIHGMPRYRLAAVDEADEQFTRFICRFHTIETDPISGKPREVIVGETFSTYPANYEFVNYRKRKSYMLSPEGKENGLFWLSNLRFDCPVPENGNLRETIASGNSVLADGKPSIYVDVVPIRTNPRWGMEESYFNEDLVGPDFAKNEMNREPGFSSHKDMTTWGLDAKTVFGDKHILPRVEASGRWANVPICKPHPAPPTKEEVFHSKHNAGGGTLKISSINGKKLFADDKNKDNRPKDKPFTLTACVWASATFHTRGGDRKVDDTMERTREWIEYHLMMGFDHIYVYDNTKANTNETDLVETLSPFSAAEVTRIDWPAMVCNNNKPAHENTGERSSQYAAESSCRQRYGQYTEWIAAFDTDEYFVPQGEFNDLRDVVMHAKSTGANVLSFKSTRAYPNYFFLEKFANGGECGKEDDPKCLAKKHNATFIETYNCDFDPLPKPDWADRARKQIYRPDYVVSHFVHYSTITKGILETAKEMIEKGKGHFDYWYRENKKSERFVDEINEAVMLHTKTTVPGNTKWYWKFCKVGFKGRWNEKCRVGFPIPGNKKVEGAGTAEDNYEYNCYTNEKITNIYAPKLRELMHKRTGIILDGPKAKPMPVSKQSSINTHD